LGFRRATAGGCSRDSDGMIVTTLSNETTIPYYTIGSVCVVGSARHIATSTDKRWRTMFRFVLRDYMLTASSLVSGMVPDAEWWPLVTGARFVFYNGDSGGLQANPSPPTITESDLLVRVGRSLYTPAGGTEFPFGSTNVQAGTCYGAAATMGMAETTLAWADWAVPDRTDVTIALSQTAIDDWLKTITGATDDYLDVSFILQQEGVDGVNIMREFGAWEPHYPTIEIDFEVDSPEHTATAFQMSGEVNATQLAGTANVFQQAGEANVTLESGEANVFRHGTETETWR
ncbi:MAG: hypothetical protein AAB426_12500, partial [Myxococcota bacterium]